MGQLIVLVAMFALLWVFLIMPQRRRAHAQRELHASVAVGDEILTIGGLIGIVRSSGEEELEIEIAPDTRVRIARRAVASVLTQGDESGLPEAPQTSEHDEEVRS